MYSESLKDDDVNMIIFTSKYPKYIVDYFGGVWANNSSRSDKNAYCKSDGNNFRLEWLNANLGPLYVSDERGLPKVS